MTDNDRAAEPSRWRYLAPAGIAVLTFIAFLPAMRAGFVAWDDDTNFLRNPMYRGLGWHQLQWMWTTFLLGHYVPLSWMTLGLDYTVWGMDARGYHFTNVVLHCANAVLIYLVACRLVRAARGGSLGDVRGPAAIAALIYSIHPLRVESAAWITERRDVLSTLFYLAAVLAYLRSIDRKEFGRWYWVTLGLFACAVLSKATAVTLPVILLIINVRPLRRLRADNWRTTESRRVYREIVPLGAISAAMGALSLVALHPGAQLAFPQKIAVSAFSLRFYLTKTLLPIGLSPLYEMPKQIDPLAASYLVSYAVCIGLLVLIGISVRRRPNVAAGMLAFVAMILPLLGVVQNGQQIAADRYTYQAMQAIAVLMAGFLARAWRRPVSIAGTAIVLALGGLTWRQTGFWRDSTTLWQRVLDIDDSSSVAHTALANVFFANGRLDEAIDHYERSLAINPMSLEVDNNLGVALAKEGRSTEAMSHYRRAIEINPAHFEAHNNLGSALSSAGDNEGAIEEFRRALAIRPDFPDAEINLGNALLRTGRPGEAITHYQHALSLRQGDADAEYNWGVALARQSKFVEAIVHFRKALAANPGHAEARNALALAEKMSGATGR